MWKSNLEYLIYIVVFIALAWLWWDQAKARVHANKVAMQLCLQQNVQFLDGTVVFQKLWPKRNADGRIGFQRYYAFDYLPEISENFEDSRKTGFIVLHGLKVLAVGLANDIVQ
ncbi:MAG: DUF3301 domain-containing protein [Gammaproteobacteria bacterium]|nr:DUF3301 domain-containing protein [Gammaproteobacteria bacterium]